MQPHKMAKSNAKRQEEFRTRKKSSEGKTRKEYLLTDDEKPVVSAFVDEVQKISDPKCKFQFLKKILSHLTRNK